MRTRFVALVLVALGLLLAAACQSRPAASGAVITNNDQAAAAVIAWFKDPATHGADADVQHITYAVEDRGSVWRVHITGDIYGQGAMYSSVMWVEIDPFGKITIVAQG